MKHLEVYYLVHSEEYEKIQGWQDIELVFEKEEEPERIKAILNL